MTANVCSFKYFLRETSHSSNQSVNKLLLKESEVQIAQQSLKTFEIQVTRIEGQTGCGKKRSMNIVQHPQQNLILTFQYRGN